MAFAAVFYPIDAAAQVLRGYRDFMAKAPDEVTGLAVCNDVAGERAHAARDPRHAVHCRRRGVYVGSAERGLRTMQPLRELATPLADISGPLPFVGVQQAFDEFFRRGCSAATGSPPT